MLKTLLEWVIAGTSLLVIFMIIERVSLMTGREMLIDKVMRHLEAVHRRSEPKEAEDMDVKEYALSDQVKVMELRFHKSGSK